MRTRSPLRRTLPSTSVVAPSFAPITLRLSVDRLNGITDVREITLSARIFDRCAMTSSVIPSAKYSFSGSALKLTNGSTATVGDCARAGAVNASANSRVDAKRSAGCLARAFMSACSTDAGTVARNRLIAGTGSNIRLMTRVCAFGAMYGGSPTSISYNTQARL